MINNAGVMLPSGVEEHRVADFERMIEVNLTGAMRVVDAFVDLPHITIMPTQQV